MKLDDLPAARTPVERATIRLRHRLFALGTGDAADLRGWTRWNRWRREPTLRWRARIVAHELALPLRAAGWAWAAVRAHGARIARAGGGPPLRQLRQLWWLRVRHGIDVESYLTFQLYRPERRGRAHRFVQVNELLDVIRLLGARRGTRAEGVMLSDKRRFEDWCRSHGLRCVPSLLAVEGGGVVGGGEVALPARDLFSKPANGRAGVGARCWRHDGEGGYRGDDGRVRPAQKVIAELEAESARTGHAVIVQARMRNHAALLPLTPGGLSTMRLVTFRHPSGEVELLAGIYRMPVGASVVDNVSQGGIAAQIDLATGTLGAGVRRVDGLYETVDRHPDTGTTIRGTRIPFWPEARELAVRAHRATDRLLLLGWDVAPLDDGPVIVEGNTLASPRVMQVASDLPVADTPLVRGLHEHLRATFGI